MQVCFLGCLKNKKRVVRITCVNPLHILGKIDVLFHVPHFTFWNIKWPLLYVVARYAYIYIINICIPPSLRCSQPRGTWGCYSGVVFFSAVWFLWPNYFRIVGCAHTCCLVTCQVMPICCLSAKQSTSVLLVSYLWLVMCSCQPAKASQRYIWHC